MRSVGVYLFTVSVVVAFSSIGCSHKSKKHKKESLNITTTTLPDATEGVAYSFTVTASGGNSANYNWSVSGQPSWLAIDSSTGKLSGTPPTGSAGTYTFTVEVTDGQQNASKQFDLLVNTPTPPKADFEADLTNGTASLAVNFTDKSTGTVTQWEWDFDNDGTPDSTVQNPSWTYNNPGWYTVKLTVTGPVGSDSRVKEMYVLVADDIYYVNGANGDDTRSGQDWSDAFATIGKALSVAGDYDLVLVADATYNETNLDFLGKKIYLKGVDHNTVGQHPVIDCQNNNRAFIFISGESKDCVIDNLMVKNGSALNGAAIYCDSSGPTITNCTFSDNGATGSCGAIYCNNSDPSIANCTFSGNNTTNFYGGAIYCNNSSPTMTNCTFSGNNANDRGGAICCKDYSSPSIVNCTFSHNSAGSSGGAIECYFNSSPTLNNSIFWQNTAGSDGNEIYADDSTCSCILNYCCVDNTTGAYAGSGTIDDSNNCIHDDPQFVDAANDDYHLKDTSPCIDAGDNSLVPSGVTEDLDGNERIADGNNDGTAVVDIGAYEKQ